MSGEGLGRFPLVEAVADGLVGDAAGAGFKLEEEEKQPEVNAPAAAEERCACHVVCGHSEGALAHAAVGEGGGGDEGGGLAGEGVRLEGGRRLWSGVRAEGVAEEGESEIGGRVQEGEPGVGGAAGGEEGVVYRDVLVGGLGSGLGRDFGEPFLTGCEGGPRLGEDAVERFQGWGGQPEDGAGGGGDGGGGEDGSARDVAAGG